MGVGNVLSGNHQPGILLYGAENVVRGNRIGVAAGSQMGLGNGIAGIYFLGSSDNLIGGTAPGAANVIAFNGSGSNGAGVDASNGSTRDSIRGNSIFGNSGPGIYLVPGSSGGGNNLQPAPQLTTVATDGSNTTIQVRSSDLPTRLTMLTSTQINSAIHQDPVRVKTTSAQPAFPSQAAGWCFHRHISCRCPVRSCRHCNRDRFNWQHFAVFSLCLGGSSDGLY